MNTDRALPWDWHPGTIPENVWLAQDAYIESTLSFECYRSQAALGLRLGQGSAIYKDTMLDLGINGSISIGDFSLIHGARLSCEGPLHIGSYVLISWQVVVMDSYRVPLAPSARRRIWQLQDNFYPQPEEVQIAPIVLQDNVWIGFDACILPGVVIGEGAVVGARSVVVEDVPPYSVVVGNPARVARSLTSPAAVIREELIP
jgi:acetyltransferase-like isoleucine patch superfamily enzyme